MASTTRHSDSFSGFVSEARTASTAGGGTALNTTAQRIILPNGTTHVGLITNTFATALVAKFALCPYLFLLKTTDNLATVANATDYSIVGQNNPSGTGIVLNALDTLANTNAVYIGSHLPFRGLDVTMSASVNSNASVLTTKFWNGSAWAAVAGFSDGTASGGKTFAQSGFITWTVPATWAKAILVQTLASPSTTAIIYGDVTPYYWLQLSVSAAFSATVKANTIISMVRNVTQYPEAVVNSVTQYRTLKGPGGSSAVEALVDAGTGNLIVDCYTDNQFEAFS